MTSTALEWISVVVSLTQVKFWFIMTCGANAAIQQLLLDKDLMIHFSPKFVDACIVRLQNHLWYICEEMTPLAIASTLICDSEYEKLARLRPNLCPSASICLSVFLQVCQ